MNHQKVIRVATQGRGASNITDIVNQTLSTHHNATLCHIFVAHTSASLMITGVEDENILLDVEDYLQAQVLDADERYRHNNEGDYDMSGHIRTILMGEQKTIPVIDQKLALGKFQGLFLYEHRAGENQRKLIITVS